MGKVIPMSWLNQILLILSILCALLSLVIQEWAGLTPLPIYVSILWAIFLIIASVWFSCLLFQLALKANCPLNIKFLNNWLYEKLTSNLKLCDYKTESEYDKNCENQIEINKDINSVQVSNENQKPSTNKGISPERKRAREIDNLVQEINLKCINVWYKSISDDASFPNEAQKLLKKLLSKLFHKINLIDKVRLTHKLSNVFLLHLKEYHRALRRVEKGTAPNVEEAFKYLHPGSRNVPALEYMLHRMVSILAQEFLQWEITSSLPCKLLLSILAKRLLIVIETVSSPIWLFQSLLNLLQPVPKQVAKIQNKQEENVSNKAISSALGDGITSATAAVIRRPLPNSKSESTEALIENKNTSLSINDKKPTLHLNNLGTEHRGLWGQAIDEMDSAIEDKISPIYEEPTDFATTIARLRTVLQQKSTVNTPLHMDEKSYVIRGNQFTNLSIPWTEFHTAFDGSQQLLYCIQFDDIEQRGVDLFETTTATVRRQYRDFAQLHASLQEAPELAPVMSNLVLPAGGRLELENYLKTLTARLPNECPSQLRHFLDPSSGINKKADVVAPGFEKFLVKTKSLAGKVQQLLTERTEYSSVDTAYEAVDSMDSTNDSALLSHWWEIIKSSSEEDIDELDSHLTLTCVIIDLICELLTGIGSNNALQQEAVVRWTKLLLGNVTESVLQTATSRIFDHLSNVSLRTVQNKLSKEPLISLRERLLQEIFIKVPNDIKLIFGEDDTLNIIKYLLDTYEIKKINMDLNLQILDVLASQLLSSCRSSHSKAPL
ncbi:hypothetical protein WN48_04643 [Eufriesea mexicana]|uniref:PXA domain-containing protein n=1 Tax=Eufriesea mexicana TaxID=516756 RepID=A0A310SJA2_9HYME|nr:hypothetical protein WN48_04643 [Eufriesea mexicana]